MGQNFTSAATSINVNKLPSLYNKVDLPKGKTIIDYGCGKYTEHIKEKMKENEIEWYGYDPYNQPKEINEETLKHRADVVVCCNVLNVIDDDETVINIVHRLFNLGKEVIVQIYEGDKSGIGRQTGKDTYQRNENTEMYRNLIESLGYKATRKGNLIFAKEVIAA